MGSGSASPPQPPGLSSEERELLTKQGLTIDKFNEILNQSSLDSASTQDLLRQLSGLYKQESIPERRIPGKPVETINTNLIQSLMTGLSSNPRLQSTIAPDQKPITAAELQRAQTDIAYARQRGFTTTTLGPEEVIPGSNKWVLNQDEVAKLRERVVAEQKKAQEITDLQNERYIKALKGELPVSQGLLDQKMDDFRLLKEGAARRGIQIEGDTPETAVSSTTSGNELVGQFKRTYGLLQDAERRGEIMGGAPSGMPSYGVPLNFATSSTSAGPQGLLPTYSNLTSMYGGAAAPYQQQRMLGYQGQVAQYNAGRQGMAGITGLMGTGAGIAAMTGHPWIAGGLLAGGVAASYL